MSPAELLDLPEQADRRAMRVTLVLRANKDQPGLSASRVSLGAPDQPERRDYPEHRVLTDPREIPDLQETLDHRDPWVTLEYPALLD